MISSMLGTIPVSRPPQNHGAKHFADFLTLIAATYAFWLIVFWPGILGQDSLAIILEVLDPINRTSGKPSFWYWFVRLTYLGHERIEVPIAAMLALGALIQARILGWCWVQGLKKTALFLLVFIALTPHFIFFIGSLYPDGIYSIAVVGLLFELWLIARNKRCDWSSLAMVALTLPFAAFARSNGVVFIAPALIVAALLWRHHRKQGLYLGLVVLAWCIVMGLGNRAHPSRGHGAVYPLAIFETVNFLQPRPMKLWTATPRVSPKTVETLEKYHPVGVYLRSYDPDYWDTLVFPEDGPKVMSLNKADKKTITREFFRYNLWRNVPKFVGSRVNIFLTACFAQGGLPSHTYSQHVLTIVQSKSTYRPFGLDKAEALMFKMYDTSYMHRWLFWTPFLGLGLLAWALVTGTRRRNWPMLLIAAPMPVQLGGIVLFSIAGEYRYILPFFALPLVLLPMYMLQIKTKSDAD